MTIQNIAAVVAQALTSANVARPVGMPETAIPVGGSMWMAVIPVTDWTNETLYSPHLFNRDGALAAEKKAHLKGKTVTDIQKTVIACLDSDGAMTKLDGHCRSKAWEAGTLEAPADGNIFCIIHVLPENVTAESPYVGLLLKHAINKAGKLTAVEEKKSAQQWAGAGTGGFVAESWFTVNSISKAAFETAKRVGANLGVVVPDFQKDLEQNLVMSVEVRKLAETFAWDMPKAKASITDKEAKAQDLKERKFAYSATMAGAFIVCHSLDPIAAACFWVNWGKPNAMNATLGGLYSEFKTSVGANQADKLALSTRTVVTFKDWLANEWPSIKDEETAKEAARVEKYHAEKEGDEAKPFEDEKPVAAVQMFDEVAALVEFAQRPEATVEELEALADEAAAANDDEEFNRLTSLIEARKAG